MHYGGYDALQLSIGPQHTDDDASLEISVRVLEVNVDDQEEDSMTFTSTFSIPIGGIADTPPDATIAAIPDQIEDDVFPLILTGAASADTDGSEDPCLEIAVPTGTRRPFH